MALIGYARVSSVGQKLDVQLEKLKAHGCADLDIFREKQSGTSDKREELQSCLRHVRRGDKLVITKLDRLARSTLHLTQIAEQLKNKSVELVVLDQHIDTSTPTGKLLFNMLASIAEFETEIRKERQMEGIAKAQSKGVTFGPKAKLSDDQVLELKSKREQGVLIKDLQEEFGLSKATVYRILKSSV